MSNNKVLAQDGHINLGLEGRTMRPGNLGTSGGIINQHITNTPKRPSPPKPIPSQNKNK